MRGPARVPRHDRPRRASGCAPRSPPRCRASPPTGAPTPSASATASASRRRRTRPVTAATFKHTLERAFSPKLGRGGPRPERGARDRRARAVPRRQGGARLGDQGARRHALDHAREAVRRLPRADLAAAPLPRPAERADPPDCRPTARCRRPGRTTSRRSRTAASCCCRTRATAAHRPQHWARIVYTLDVPTPHAVALVDRGELDYLPAEFDGDSLLWRHGVLDDRYGPGSAAAEHGGQRYFPTTGQLPRLHRAQREPPALPRRADAACGQVRARPAARSQRPSTTSRATRSSRRAVDGFPAGAVYPVDGPDLATARRLAGNRARRAVLTYCTFFPFGDDGLRSVAPLVKADLARIGIDVSIVRTDECPTEYDASSNRADLLLVTNFGQSLRDPLPYLDPALARGPYASALGPGPWRSASFRRRFEAAQRAARARAHARLRAARARADAGGAVRRLRHVLVRAVPLAADRLRGDHARDGAARPRGALRQASVQVKRVRLSRGASTPGRGPRWTSSTGGRASRTSARRVAPMPSLRQRGEMPDDDEARVRDRVDEPVRIGEHGRRVDLDDALDGERRVGEQAARVAAPAARVGARADEPQRRAGRRGERRRRARARPSRARRRRTGRGRRAPRRARRPRARPRARASARAAPRAPAGAAGRRVRTARRRARGRPRSPPRAGRGRTPGRRS